MKVVTQMPNTYSMGLLLTLQNLNPFLMVDRENRLQLSHILLDNRVKLLIIADYQVLFFARR